MNNMWKVGFLGAMGILSLATSLFPGDDARRHRNYLPLQIGYKWVYEIPGGQEQTMEITGIQKMGQIDCFTATIGSGGGHDTRNYTLSAKGIQVLYEPDKPQWLLKYPPEKGKEWDYDRSGATFRFRNAGEEVVAVPAGRFSCVKISIDYGDGFVTAIWLANGVGIVKVDPAASVLGLEGGAQLKRLEREVRKLK